MKPVPEVVAGPRTDRVLYSGRETPSHLSNGKRLRRNVRAGILAGALAIVLSTRADSRAPQPPPADPLADEIARWSERVRVSTSTDELWVDVKQMTAPALAAADAALRADRRLFALQRLAAARVHLAAAAYVGERSPAERADAAFFEAEWARMGKALAPDLSPIPPTAFDGVTPAAVRAVAEAALPQVRIYYDASLEYGRSTMPESGLFYLGAAQSQRDLAAFCRLLSTPSPRPAPPLRPLGAELDALESTLLALYRPPASIERHAEFITASASLKEARELDAAGLRYGALLRYLQAAQRTATLGPAPKLAGAAVDARLAEIDLRLRAGASDDTIGRTYLETARAELASAQPGTTPTAAPVIAADVLPRYFAALEPARPRPLSPEPRVTVTLVRWPYT